MSASNPSGCIRSAAEQGAELVCFPEIQLTPFFPQYTGRDSEPYVMREDDPAILSIREACRERRILAATNFYLDYGGRRYDTSLLIDATGEIEFKGTKTIEGRPFKQGDTATFTVESLDDAPTPEHPEVTINPTKDESIAIDFGKITYKLSDLPEGAGSAA